MLSSTWPDALQAEDGQRHGVQVRPGQTASVTVWVRFGPVGAGVAGLGQDAYRSFAAQWPRRLNWKDRRVIGTVFLASSGQGDKSRSAGFPSNPRRYFTDAGVDVKTPEGLHRFQLRVLAQADTIVANFKG